MILNRLNCFIDSPLDKTNPPKTRTASKAKDPNVFATIIFLPSAAINRNSPDAIWLINRSRRNCLKNLPQRTSSNSGNSKYGT